MYISLISIVLASFVFTSVSCKRKPVGSELHGKVNSTEISILQAPWQASLQLLNSINRDDPCLDENGHGPHICSGAIIGRKWILSSSGCYERMMDRISNAYARVGSAVCSEGGALFKVTGYRPQNYDVHKLEYDLTLFKLEDGLKFNDKIKPIKLPHKNMQLSEGQMCFTSGWGTYYGGGSETLRGMKVSIINQELCDSKFRPGKICAGWIDYDFLEGDMGGPLVTYVGENKVPILVGIASKDFRSFEPDASKAYARVYTEREWITEISWLYSSEYDYEYNYDRFKWL